MKLVTVVGVDDQSVRCMEHGDGLGGQVHEVPNDSDHVILDGELVELAIGELEVDGNEYLLTVLDRRAIEYRVRLRGASLELSPVVGRGGMIVREAELLGVPGERERAWVRNARLGFLVVDPEAPVPGHWWVEGGLTAWLQSARIRAADRQKEQAGKAQAHQRHQQEAEAASLRARPVEDLRRLFINPYTFVPFAGEVQRGAPAGHRALGAGRLAGSLRITFTTLTPLLVRRPGPGGASFPVRVLDDGRRVPIVAGSSLKGALRSLHETLAGGCLRVVDQDFVPVYRDPPRPRDGSWTLARVEAVDGDGFPTQLTLCDEVVWVEATELHPAVRTSGLRTGSTVDLDPNKIRPNARARRQELQPDGVREGSGWVVLVTDERARSPKHPYHCAVGHLGFPSGGVSPSAWATYLQSVAEADDVRRAQQPGGQAAQYQAVTFRGSLVGQRRTAGRALHVHDVMWVRTDGPARPGAAISAIALSALWRSPGKGPMGERFPPSLRPCHDPGNLCVSCRLFGAVDDEGGRGPAGDQHGYRGHVRVGEARAVGDAQPIPWPLAPLGPPRPGAGQFYLVHDGAPAGKEQRPSREWGAEAEGSRPRPLRGRKHYWHGDPQAQQPTPRHRAREHQTHEMAEQAELVEVGVTFQGAIRFENLDPDELGSLLAVLDPTAVLSDQVPPGYTATPQLAVRLGGGKPLGLGSIELGYQDLRVHDAASRYGDGTAAGPQAAPAELLGGFVAGTPESVRATWPDLAAVLDVGHVDPRWIWYPPGSPWPDPETESVGKAFDDGFEFWKRTSGQYLADAEDLPELAAPREPNQFLGIIEKPPQ
jgi:CRISPR-associated protein (TIGR03986 family)